MAATTATTSTAANTATTQAAAALPKGQIAMPGVLAWFSAWILVIGLLWGISKTRWGHTITYYVLWLAVALVLVSHYQDISNILTQGNITQGQQ